MTIKHILNEEELATQKEMDEYLDNNIHRLGKGQEKEILQFTKLAQEQHEAMKKTKQITLRISERDLIKIKSKSIELGIPYQTLIGSQIHQYANS